MLFKYKNNFTFINNNNHLDKYINPIKVYIKYINWINNKNPYKFRSHIIIFLDCKLLISLNRNKSDLFCLNQYTAKKKH